MPNIDQCIILAAGNGSRLVQRSSAIPKPLVELQGRPLLEHVIGRAQEAGITNFVVVVGYRGDAIRQWVAEQDFAGITVSCIENLDYLKDNGISVLAARVEVSGPFLLLMSDHIFDAATASALVRQPLQQDEVILAVDSNLDRVFDLDDATKVRRDGDRIIAIGKNLVDYDGFDTGMFLCGPGLFDALESAKKSGNCSLSDGMRKLGEAGKFHAFDIGDASWQDVDTPEALAYAEGIFGQFVCTTLAGEEFSRAKLTSAKRRILRLVTAIFGCVLLAYLVDKIGIPKLMQDVEKLGWGILVIIALGGVGHVAKAWAWRLALPGEGKKVSFLQFFKLRLASEAVGQLGILGQAFGEGLRVSALSSEVPIASRVSSVTMDRGLFVVTGALVALVGIVAAAFSMNLAHRWLSYAAIFAITLIALLLALALAVQKEWGILSGPARLAKRLRYCREWLEKREHLIVSIEEKLFSFPRDASKAFWMSFGLNVLTHLAALSEIYVVLRLMGFNIGVVGALIFEALTKLVNVVGLINPGNVGTYEGGNVLIARMFNLGADAGMVVAVARRIRAIFWASIGVVYLVVLTKHKKRCPSQDNMDSCGETGGPQPSPACQTDSQSAARARIAIVIAGTPQQVYDIRSPLTRIGTLPVILRTILGIQKAGATRVIVCGDSQNAPALRCELEATGRLPASVEWFEITPSTRNLGSILGRLALEAEPDPLLVVAGDTAYYPALLRDAIAWDGTTEALAFLSDSKPIGIWSLPSAVATRIAERCEDGARDSELYPRLTENAVEHRDVPKDRWQQVLTEADRGAAEEKLNRWLVKPTDGLFARFNRRISVPVSRQLIKWPITPNMVSLFTLAVGFVSGFFFACGGYWNTVFAAVLSVWASILDGCDGEVARLKLQESDFGCWLETICDYLYYLSIFSGMAIGLVRRSGPTYVVWTELLLAGAVMSFLVTGMGRRRIAGARPEQYLGIWQTQAESRQSNPILYIGRHTEFIIRRCFLPYALLAFALLNLTKVAFIMSAIGVNLVWLISLYSYRSFTAAPASPAADSVGPA